MAEEEKKKGTAEKAGEATGEAVGIGVDEVKGLGKGPSRRFNKKDDKQARIESR